mmetsp:Transcript_13250/g.31105  ORF Transcript_13250/g.31105 Transcript_13250/m.31105 type:complete len:206 (-) Transcript_13250:512-1129(-)
MRLRTEERKASWKVRSEKRVTELREFLCTASSSASDIFITLTICSAYSSAVVARKPVGFPSQSTTMSSFGPAELCAIGSTPAAMNSTTLMPKCSFHIVCIPARAVLSHFPFKSPHGTLTCRETVDSSPCCFTRSCTAWTRASSPAPRQLPMIASLTEEKPLSFSCFIASTCSAWFFSGRNCPREMTSCSRPASAIVCRLSVLQGG